MQKCIFVQFSAPNRGFATSMAILRASNVNHRGITLPKFCRTSTAVFVEHSAGCCAILLAKNADWKLQDIWRKAAWRQTEIYRNDEEEKHNGQQKSTERLKENSTTAEEKHLPAEQRYMRHDDLPGLSGDKLPTERACTADGQQEADRRYKRRAAFRHRKAAPVYYPELWLPDIN